MYDSEPSLACATGETVELSENEARERAEHLLSRLGFEGFAFLEGGLYSEPLRLDRESGDYYGTYYILRYMRCIDGVMLTQPSGTKMYGGRENGEGKKQWSPECIELRINDDGVVGLDIYSPLEITETLVECASLESIDMVCESVEKLLTIAAASEFYEKSIKIDSVTLRYSRISEADGFDEGMLVPVWDISGLCEYSSAGYVFRRVYESVMVINAVDGTVMVDGS